MKYLAMLILLMSTSISHARVLDLTVSITSPNPLSKLEAVATVKSKLNGRILSVKVIDKTKIDIKILENNGEFTLVHMTGKY